MTLSQTKGEAYSVVPTPFHKPRAPSAFQTWRTASKKPLKRSALNIPASHTHTTSAGNVLANEDMLRTHAAALEGWQQALAGGRGKSGRGCMGWVCILVFTRSKGVTGGRSAGRGAAQRIAHTGQGREGRARRCCDKLCLECIHGTLLGGGGKRRMGPAVFADILSDNSHLRSRRGDHVQCFQQKSLM
jgi:hypothetical protein